MILSTRLDVIICADWSKSQNKRAIWIADLRPGLAIRRLEIIPRTFGSLIREAGVMASSKSRVLVTFDAPLGLPRSYFESVRTRVDNGIHSFLDWLSVECVSPRELFNPVGRPEEWSVSRPFFRIPKGKGSFNAFTRAAAMQGINLWRDVDRRTHAKSMFATGIPGQVACAAQELWKEMADLKHAGCAYKVWPFDGSIEKLLQHPGIVIGEIYPAVAYAIAIDYPQQQLFSSYGLGISARRVFSVVKSSPTERKAAITALKRSI